MPGPQSLLPCPPHIAHITLGSLEKTIEPHVSVRRVLGGHWEQLSVFQEDWWYERILESIGGIENQVLTDICHSTVNLETLGMLWRV
jgi:hypothetical protein